MDTNLNSSAAEDDGSIFYTVHNIHITYSYFSLNVMMIVVHVGIIALNSCMIAAIRRTRKINDPSGHCLIGLSAAYIWHGLMMIYTGIYGLVQMQQLHECLIRFGLVHASFMMISWSNCMLTMDRYLQIEFPFWYKKHMHTRTIWIGHGITAALSIFYGISTLLFHWYIPKEGNRENVCEYFQILPALHLQLFYLLTFIGFPFLVVAYSRLLIIARKHKNSAEQLARTIPAKLAAKENKRKWRPVKIVLTICTVYIVCWGVPAVYGFLLTLIGQYPALEEAYLSTMAALIMVPSLSSIINPCIFTLHKEVKKRFLEIIKCKSKQRNDFESSFSSERWVSSKSSKLLNLVPHILTPHRNKSQGEIHTSAEANNNSNTKADSPGKRLAPLPRRYSCDSLAGSPLTVISFELEIVRDQEDETTVDTSTQNPVEETALWKTTKSDLEDVAMGYPVKEENFLDKSVKEPQAKNCMDNPTREPQEEISLDTSAERALKNNITNISEKGGKEKPTSDNAVNQSLQENSEPVLKDLVSVTGTDVSQSPKDLDELESEAVVSSSCANVVDSHPEQISSEPDFSSVSQL